MSNALATVVKYDTDSGVAIELSPQTVKDYLVRGNGNVSDQEVVMFLELCRAQRLNPFVNDAYLIKYGNSPASIVTGWHTFLKRAESHPEYDGLEAGVTILTPGASEGAKRVERRKGTLVLPGEDLVGGWAKVYRKDRTRPVEIELNISEYDKKQSSWNTMKGTMIRKTAASQGLREAFPDALSGMYTGEELGADAESAPNTPAAPAPSPAAVQPVEDAEFEIVDDVPRDLSELTALKGAWATRFNLDEKAAGADLMDKYGDPRSMTDDEYGDMLAAISEVLDAPDAGMAEEDIEF